MKKILIIAVFACIAYFLILKPKQEEQEAEIRMAEIEDELLAIGDLDKKIAYVKTLLLNETNQLVLSGLQEKLNMLEATKQAYTTTSNSNRIETPRGIVLDYTSAQVKKVGEALARIKNDFNQWANSHYDTADLYEHIGDIGSIKWTDAEVAKLIYDWDSKKNRSLYEAAKTQNWNAYIILPRRRKRMTKAADAFKLRLKTVESKYF